ncbi:hypothetical protein AB4Y86_16605 [Arthrobacter sp. 2YAF22_2]
MAQISVRLKGPLAVEQQREIAGEASSYLHNTPTRGPQLTASQEESLTSRPEIMNHEGRATVWILNYWWECEISPSGLQLNFSWPERNIQASFSIAGEEIAGALKGVVQLWHVDANESGYTGE